jgi:hypothetical protein
MTVENEIRDAILQAMELAGVNNENTLDISINRIKEVLVTGECNPHINLGRLAALTYDENTKRINKLFNTVIS